MFLLFHYYVKEKVQSVTSHNMDIYSKYCAIYVKAVYLKTPFCITHLSNIFQNGVTNM